MEITTISIQLGTSQPERMRAFYRDVVGLEPDVVGEGSFKLGPAGTFFVIDHSEVSGPTKESARAILDLHVADIDAEHARLEAAGVKFMRSKGLEWWGGVISTFKDPDGNTVQLMQYKPELATEEPEASHAG